MAALALQTPLTLKARNSYIAKGSVDEIQDNESQLQNELIENSL